MLIRVPKPALAAPLNDVGTPSVGDNNSLMAAALRALKGGLKPTITMEKHGRDAQALWRGARKEMVSLYGFHQNAVLEQILPCLQYTSVL